MLSPITPSLPLEWVQPDIKYAFFELRAQAATVGTLRTRRPGRLHFLAQASTGSWVFTPSRSIRRQVLITRFNESEPFAVFQATEDGGALRMQDGRVYTWLRRAGCGLWMERHSHLLVQLHLPEGLTTDGGQTIIAPPAFTLPELPLLILLGWCLLALELDDLLNRIHRAEASDFGNQASLMSSEENKRRELRYSSL